MPSEHYQFTVEGRRITAVLDHATACDVLSVAGVAIPAIPPGCNTVDMPFTTAAGKRALAVNQLGFRPEARDNEHEVNGLMVLILDDGTGLSDDAADHLLQFVRRRIEVA